MHKLHLLSIPFLPSSRDSAPQILQLSPPTLCASISMAPKRRKKGFTRMDAALDQMSIYGFSRQLVRKTVGNLLKLYGDDGWKLIEEDAYRVLLDVILEEQETAETHNLSKDASSTKLPDEDESIHENGNGESSEPSPPPLLSIKELKQECWIDADMNRTDLHSSLFHTDDDPPASKVNLQNSENTPLSRCAYDAVDAPVNVPKRRRRPCFGWISDDENEDDDANI